MLAAWEAVHADTLVFLADLTPEKLCGPARGLDNKIRTVGDILQLLARHDLGHIRQAEAVLTRLTS